MNQENVMRRGQLAIEESKRNELAMQIDNGTKFLRIMIDPFVNDPDELKNDAIVSEILQWSANIDEHRKLSAKIKALKDDLGIA